MQNLKKRASIRFLECQCVQISGDLYNKNDFSRYTKTKDRAYIWNVQLSGVLLSGDYYLS